MTADDIRAAMYRVFARPLQFAAWSSGGSSRNPYWDSAIHGSQVKDAASLAYSKYHNEQDSSHFQNLADLLDQAGSPSTAHFMRNNSWESPQQHIPVDDEGRRLSGHVQGVNVRLIQSEKYPTIWQFDTGGSRFNISHELAIGIIHEMLPHPESYHNSYPSVQPQRIADAQAAYPKTALHFAAGKAIKPADCTCEYPEKTLRNGSGHGRDANGKMCPHHRRYLIEHVWRKGSVKLGMADNIVGHDQHAFHRAITADLEDSSPKLIYADWLEEHGLPGHAHVIREFAKRSGNSQGTFPDITRLKGVGLASFVREYQPLTAPGAPSSHFLRTFLTSPVNTEEVHPLGILHTTDSDLAKQFMSEMSDKPYTKLAHRLLIRRMNKKPLQFDRTGGETPLPDERKPRLYIEQQTMDAARPDTKKSFRDLASQAVNPKTAPFSAPLPVQKTLTALGQLGQVTKGEYAATTNAVKELFGHDKHGVTAWMMLNGILSPQTRYVDHAGAASLLTAKFLALKPRDRKNEQNIERIIKETQNVGRGHGSATGGEANVDYAGQSNSFGFALSTGVKREAAKQALLNIEDIHDALANPQTRDNPLVSNARALKVINFINSYLHPTMGAPIDTHMLRVVMNPSLEDLVRTSPFLKQFAKATDSGKELTELQKASRSGTPISSDLIRLLMRNQGTTAPSGRLTKEGDVEKITGTEFLKRVNTELITRPAVYLAYKHALHTGAKKLGWQLSELQESVWTGLVALMAANSVAAKTGVSTKEAIQALDNEAIRKGWQNHEALYFPSLVDAYSRTRNPEDLERQLSESQRRDAEAASRPLHLPGSTYTHLSDIAAHLPQSGSRDAGAPIRRKLMEVFGKWGMQPKRMGLRDDIREAASTVHDDPSEAQRQAGNYRMGHIIVQGLPITIENAAGSTRSGKDKSGKPWSIVMKNHYGYIKRTESEADGDHIDVFVGPHPDSEIVFIVDQNKGDSSHFDEHKVMVGWKNCDAAKYAYLSNYSEGWKGFRDITPLTIDQFKRWLTHGNTGRPAKGQAMVMKLRMRGEPVRMAHYDMPVNFVSALERASASNYKSFAEAINKVLRQSGIIPHEVTPAVHDVLGNARAALFAAGQYRNPQAPVLGAAWTGMLARQPGMLSFTSDPNGRDSVYRFAHGDADVVRQALDQAGVPSRTLVPNGKDFHVYVFDKGRQKREQVAQALAMLGATADEWYGNGQPVGGKQEDMGREQYRNVINAGV